MARGVEKKDFNSYGSRRGNDRVMVRGTFANIRLKNLLVPGVEGGVTVHVPSGERMAIYDAAERYRREGTPLVVLAGKEYGTGSSRDWAAKGTLLLGVRAVDRGELRAHPPHRTWSAWACCRCSSRPAQNAESLGLTGHETLTIRGLAGELQPRQERERRGREGGRLEARPSPATARLDTPVEIDYYRNGGILQTVLRKMV